MEKEKMENKKNINTEKIHIFHSDSGHGWLAVKRNELTELGIESQISHYSYQNGDTVYLEEDRDATLFFYEFKKKFNCEPIFKKSYIDGRSPIRSYYNYQDE